MKIGIVVIATNAYLPLGIKFIKKFLYHYTGNHNIVFYLFSNENPYIYLSDKESSHVIYIEQKHTRWLDATNSKYNNILSLAEEGLDYIFYCDADTDIRKNFDDNWFIGDLVGCEHFANRSYEIKPYDRNPKSKAYIDHNTTLPQTYYHASFYGGTKQRVLDLCKELSQWQVQDKNIGYEPIWNDESYLNAYLHHNPPTKVATTELYPFRVSDKGGMEGTRDINLDIASLKNDMIINKDRIYNFVCGKISVID